MTVSLAHRPGRRRCRAEPLSGALEVGINVSPTAAERPDHGAGRGTRRLRGDRHLRSLRRPSTTDHHFPAGSLAIVAEEGSSGPRVVGIVIGALLFVAIIGLVIAWRRGWLRIGSRKRQQEEPDRPQS